MAGVLFQMGRGVAARQGEDLEGRQVLLQIAQTDPRAGGIGQVHDQRFLGILLKIKALHSFFQDLPEGMAWAPLAGAGRGQEQDEVFETFQAVVGRQGIVLGDAYVHGANTLLILCINLDLSGEKTDHIRPGTKSRSIPWN